MNDNSDNGGDAPKRRRPKGRIDVNDSRSSKNQNRSYRRSHPIRRKNSREKTRAEIANLRTNFLSGIGTPEKVEFKADEFQLEAINSVIEGNDTLVVAPTGAGKTYIAFEAIANAAKLGLRGVYTTPLKALSNSKYSELKTRFSGTYDVGLLTGDRKIDGSSQIVVATTEIYRNELYQGSERDSLVVLDEVHFIADAQRGPVWEESIILTPKGSTLLMLSASISNAEEIAEWISEVRGRECKIVSKTERPVELRYGFLHPFHGVVPLFKDGMNKFNTEKKHTNIRRTINDEVLDYYSGSTLERNGMRLKGGNFSPKRDRNSRENNNSRRNSGRNRRNYKSKG